MHCLHPIDVKNSLYRYGGKEPLYRQVPCGKCIACQERRRTEWAYRLETEAKFRQAWFVTLTYDPSFLPLVNFDSGEFVPTGTLAPEDVTLFLKRLRKRFDTPLSYFYCGEYGCQGNRPHYHMILYVDSSLDEVRDKVDKSWCKGFICVDRPTLDRFRYVAKYVVKLGNDRLDPASIQPFARMSTRIWHGELDYTKPIFDKKTKEFLGYKKVERGLGVPSKDVLQWHRDNDVWSSRLSNGECLSTPRYIRELTFSPIEIDLHRIQLDNASRNRFSWRSRDCNWLSWIREDFLDDCAWEKFKIKQFYIHYLNKSRKNVF